MIRLISFVALFVPLTYAASAHSSDLKYKHTTGNLDYYSGTIKVSGHFELRLDETSVQIMGKPVCFFPEGESMKLIPRINDRRTPWFCFSNRDDAMKMLEIPNQESGTCGFTGTAEVVIAGYVADRTEGDVYDKAQLVAVIKHSHTTPLPCE